VRDEANALTQLAARLDTSFCDAVDRIVNCSGDVITLGIGKAGLVAQKIAATFCSTGTRSFFLHPSEALHGDLGRVSPDDVALVLSHSGQTQEIVCLVPLLKQLRATVIGITGRSESDLAQSADITVSMGPVHEAGKLGLAPTCSTTAMMALGDALALVASEARDFRAEDFARFHPGGSLGRMLSRVSEVMRPLDRCRVGNQNRTVREVLVQVGRPGRRTGAVMLTDDLGKLAGLFTDSDLARLFEHHRDDCIDRPIRHVMTVAPMTIEGEALLGQAVQRLSQRRISELPVVDPAGRPLGLIDITDILAMLPADGHVAKILPNTNSSQAVTESVTNSNAKQASPAVPAILPFPKNPQRSP
jgi:arabinose-5-phosphate isomerase